MTFGMVYVCMMLRNSEQVTITQEQVIMTFAPLTIKHSPNIFLLSHLFLRRLYGNGNHSTYFSTIIYYGGYQELVYI
jgi:hypothetical protein